MLTLKKITVVLTLSALAAFGLFLSYTIFSDTNETSATDTSESAIHVENNNDNQAFIYSQWQSTLGVPVLCYHQVLPATELARKPTPYAVSVTQFASQMQLLYQEKFKTIDIEDYYRYIATGPSALPNNFKGYKPILITFDDGLKDFIRYAEPIMQKLSYKAVLFIYPTYINARKKRALSWGQIKNVYQRGHTIGSHTLWHPFLNGLTEKEEDMQFNRSKRSILRNTQIEVQTLAYPFGVYSANSRHLLEKNHYKAAFTVFAGANLPGQNYAIYNRYIVLKGHSLALFKTYLLARTLPLVEEMPKAGAIIAVPTAFSARIPKSLEQANISVRFGGMSLPFQYNALTGEISTSLPQAVKKVNVFSISYKTNDSKYKAILLYNRPSKKV